MKLRLVGTEDEFEQVFPELEQIRKDNPDIFDSWRKPQRGSNPKYEGSNNYLMYLELTAPNFLRLLGLDGTRATGASRPHTVDTPFEDVTHAPEQQGKPPHQVKVKLLPAPQQAATKRNIGDGTSLIIRPKKP